MPRLVVELKLGHSEPGRGGSNILIDWVLEIWVILSLSLGVYVSPMPLSPPPPHHPIWPFLFPSVFVSGLLHDAVPRIRLFLRPCVDTLRAESSVLSLSSSLMTFLTFWFFSSFSLLWTTSLDGRSLCFHCWSWGWSCRRILRYFSWTVETQPEKWALEQPGEQLSSNRIFFFPCSDLHFQWEDSEWSYSAQPGRPVCLCCWKPGWQGNTHICLVFTQRVFPVHAPVTLLLSLHIRTYPTCGWWWSRWQTCCWCQRKTHWRVALQLRCKWPSYVRHSASSRTGNCAWFLGMETSFWSVM